MTEKIKQLEEKIDILELENALLSKKMHLGNSLQPSRLSEIQLSSKHDFKEK
jgi:hypothetical protein